MKQQLSVQRDPAGKFQRSMVQHHKVDTGRQKNLESLRRLSTKIGRDVDIGIRSGTARRAAAVQVSKDGAVILQRLDSSQNSLVNQIHDLIVALRHCVVEFLTVNPTRPSIFAGRPARELAPPP